MLSLQNDRKCTDFARGIIDQYGLQVTVMFEDEIDKLFLELISEKLEEKRIKDEKAEANFTLAEKTADQECEAAKKKAEQNRDNAIALAKSERKIVKENNDFSCLDSISTGQSEDSPPARDVARGKNEEIVEKVYFSSEPQKILPSDLDHKEKTYGKQ